MHIFSIRVDNVNIIYARIAILSACVFGRLPSQLHGLPWERVCPRVICQKNEAFRVDGFERSSELEKGKKLMKILSTSSFTGLQ
jgi:hypothetical protein